MRNAYQNLCPTLGQRLIQIQRKCLNNEDFVTSYLLDILCQNSIWACLFSSQSNNREILCYLPKIIQAPLDTF